jgi:hypothetical protein
MALAHDSVGLVILWSCITSVGVGAAFAAIPNLIVVAANEHETGEATGVNTVMRNIGSAVGAQVAGTIIATHALADGLTGNAGFTIAFLVSARSRHRGAVRAAHPGPPQPAVRSGDPRCFPCDVTSVSPRRSRGDFGSLRASVPVGGADDQDDVQEDEGHARDRGRPPVDLPRRRRLARALELKRDHGGRREE